MIVLIYILLTFSIVYIIDFSGILFDLSKLFYEVTTRRKWKYQMIRKPFGCSQCMTFWSILIYSLFSQPIIISLFAACLMALSVNLFKLLINFYNKKTLQ